jgi:hypothetical protein
MLTIPAFIIINAALIGNKNIKKNRPGFELLEIGQFLKV